MALHMRHDEGMSRRQLGKLFLTNQLYYYILNYDYILHYYYYTIHCTTA